MKKTMINAIRILREAQKQSIEQQLTHMEEINDAMFEVFVNGTEEQFGSLANGIVISSKLLYKIGHWVKK